MKCNENYIQYNLNIKLEKNKERGSRGSYWIDFRNVNIPDDAISALAFIDRF